MNKLYENAPIKANIVSLLLTFVDWFLVLQAYEYWKLSLVNNPEQLKNQ